MIIVHKTSSDRGLTLSIIKKGCYSMTSYVIDTSSLIYDPDLIRKSYPGDNIIIPMTVLRELDGMKSRKDEASAAAREVLRNIEILRSNSDKSIAEGILRPVGGILRTEMNNITIPYDREDVINHLNHAEVITDDDKIIVVTLNLREKDDSVILMTQDRSMSIIAESWGVPSVNHIVEDTSDIGKGVTYLQDDGNLINSLFSENYAYTNENIPVNYGVVLKNGSQSALAISDGDGELSRVKTDITLCGITPRGSEQKIAANLLTGNHNGIKPEEFLGSLSGRPGSGKTTLAVAAGLYGVQQGWYDRVIVFRPTMPLTSNTDLGFLPGGIEEKMSPWTSAITDVIKSMNGGDDTIKIRNSNANDDLSKVIPIEDILTVEPVNFIRGRGFKRCFVILDEAQNAEPHVVKTVATRMGEGSALVLTWDAHQIDNNFIRSNVAEGPISLLKNLMPNDMVWHIDLKNSERGGISALINY